MRARHLAVTVLLVTTLGATACSDRMEPPTPTTVAAVDSVKTWSEERAHPYGIPERALRAYAYAAAQTEGGESRCNLGWPTVAALGAVLSDHGHAAGSRLNDDGTTTVTLRGLNLIDPARPMVVPDTDEGRVDGDRERDIPVGPMQIMPSRWEQYATSVEAGREPDVNDIDDAALTMAGLLCSAGDLSTPEGWDSAVKSINPAPDFVKAVHAKAEEYSR